MVSRIGFLHFLLDEQARSLSPVRATPLAQALAGMTRFLLELVAGESAVAGEEAQSGTNGQGLVGVDLSGPPWGPALIHPIATWSGLADAVSVEQAEPAVVTRCIAGVPAPAVLTWIVDNRPFDSPDGIVPPYSRGLVTLSAHRANATNADVMVQVRNRSMGQSFADTDDDGAESISVTSASETVFPLGVDFWVDLKPGLQALQFLFYTDDTGAEIVIDSLCIYQGAKLAH